MNSLVGAALASVLVAVAMITWLPPYLKSRAEPLENAAAVQLATVTEATRTHLRMNFSTLVTQTASGVVVLDPPALIASGALSDSFLDHNIFGQKHAALIRQTTPTQLEALVITHGGDTIPDSTLLQVAQSGAGNAGVLLSSSPTQAEGAAGGWARKISLYTNPTLSLTPGHLAALIPAAGSDVLSPYLNRYDTGNPDDTTMHTTLNMGGNAITNVSDLTLSSLNNFSLIRGLTLYTGIHAAGDLIPKPACPVGFTPQIFVIPVMASDNGTGGALSALQAGATASGANWTVTFRVRTEAGWVTPDATHGKVNVETKCG